VHFPRKGTLFLLFWNLINGKKSKKSVPLRGKQSKLVKNCIFLVRVHFFYTFEIWKIVKKSKKSVKKVRKTVKIS
jgi:hypothetical protein